MILTLNCLNLTTVWSLWLNSEFFEDSANKITGDQHGLRVIQISKVNAIHDQIPCKS